MTTWVVPGRRIRGVAPLAGDASTRRYERILLEPRGSLVGVTYPEEGSDGLRFLAVHRLLERAGIRVPRIVWVEEGGRRMLLEDLGDETLQQRLAREGEPAFRRYYPRAVAMMARFHRLREEAARLPPPWEERRLDPPRLLAELEHFHEHLLAGLLAREISRAERSALERLYQRLAGEAGAPPWRLCHRDFHVRNLMVTAGELVLIDYQDAMLGHPGYDLASLVRDAYVDLGPARRRRIRRWLEEARDPEDPGEPVGDARLAACSAQRTLKAAGTFAFQSRVRGHRGYLPYLPGVLRSALVELAAIPGLEEERTVLVRLLPPSWRPRLRAG